jgi:small subunit ribosomal protein S9
MTAVEKETVLEKTTNKSTPAIVREAKLDKFGRAYGTGKRKNAIARVWVKKGTGKIIINGKQAKEYLKRDILVVIINQPFETIEMKGKFDTMITVSGGGLSGQAGAIRHGLSRALQNFNPEFRPALKLAGFLTRDARVVERKKPGLRKARKERPFRKR